MTLGEQLSDRLTDSVQYVPGVGPVRARLLERLGIHTVADLLEHFPCRHEDRRHLVPIARLVPGQEHTVCARVLAVQNLRTRRRGFSITKAAVGDGTGVLYAVWFNQPYLVDRLKRVRRLALHGKVRRRFGQLQMLSPEWEELDEEEQPVHSGRLVPIYPLTEGMSQKVMRTVVLNALQRYGRHIPEPFPVELRRRLELVDAQSAYRHLHFPASPELLERARRRLAFEELFLIQLGLRLLRRRYQESGEGVAHQPDGPLVRRFLDSLPFQLTGAQQRAIAEIRQDMERPVPMNRLLQGDVGSGKTVVAAWALVKAAEGGWQAAMMAPTEILAEQHHHRLQELLEPLGLKVALLSGSLGAGERRQVLEAISEGRVEVAVGTHALIQEGVRFQRLGLVVCDEQHRFGVRQRALLQGKGRAPDVLVMTATPIPRTLALTVYGDLDLSVLDELPPGRGGVTTRVYSSRRRGDAYRRAREAVECGHQVYVVCPLIEESEALQLRAAAQWAEELARREFAGLRVQLLHGRMPPAERRQVMERFRRGEIDVLVCTTVVEVGVDVPNATVMIVEGAERFGLAQLHQLRGRVGRGPAPSWCLLVTENPSREARARLEAFAQAADGFSVAEADLRLRGPGQFFGTRQHGLPDLRIADPLRDVELLLAARREAEAMIENFSIKSNPALFRALRRKLGEGLWLAAIS